jgi:putative peptidoglycan lipid II flippase
MVLSGPIVSVLFERGAFNAADSVATALALAAFAAGLPAFAGAKVLQPLFFARTQMRLPFIIALIGMAADVALSLALFPVWRQTGIAVAAAASGWINLILLAIAAWRSGLLQVDVTALRRLPRLVLAAFVMTGAVWVLSRELQGWMAADQHMLLRVLVLGAVCAAGFGIYLIACLVLGALDRRSKFQSLTTGKQ